MPIQSSARLPRPSHEETGPDPALQALITNHLIVILILKVFSFFFASLSHRNDRATLLSLADVAISNKRKSRGSRRVSYNNKRRSRMNALCKAHFQSLSYSRKLVVTRMKREPTRFCNELLLIPSSHSMSRLVPSFGHVRNIHLLADEDKCDISTSELRRIVKSRFSSYKEGFTCVAVNCPSCNQVPSKESSSDLGKLYINLRTGYSFCTRCFLQGPWSSLDSYMKALEKYNPKTASNKTDIK